MGRLSSTVVSQMLVVGLVVPAIPYAMTRTADASASSEHRTEIRDTASAEDLAAEARYVALASLAPAADEPLTVEEAAVALADSLAAIPVGPMQGATSCPTEKLAVSWTEPGDEYVQGAFVTPLGPAPGPEDEKANGVVLCEGYPFAFMGFEAKRADGEWNVVAVPYLGDEDGHEPANDDADHQDEDDHAHGHDDAPTAPKPAVPQLELPASDLGPIDAYAKYEPQRICHASAKPGTLAMSRLLLGRYPVTRNLGIVRGCSIGGRSEHKEGRAFDWGAYAHRDSERQSVDDMITRMLATDEAGNRHALARRMGVMYIIWNQRIWSAYRPEAGWRPYGGRSPHTDHAHISLSWDGAMGRTSFWRAGGVETLLAMPVGAGAPSGGAPAAGGGADGGVLPGAAPAPGQAGSDHGHDDHRDDGDERKGPRGPDREARREEYERRLEDWREARERRRQERQERRGAGLPIDEESEAEVSAREAEEAAEEAEQALEEAEKEAERAERRQEREADRAARKAEWERRHEAREERKTQRLAEREERRAQKEADRAAKDTERAERRAQKEADRAAKDTERAERRAQKEADRAARDTERAERRAQKEAEREERRRQREGSEDDDD